MLTLTRRVGERIAIGGDIEITVVDVGRGKVRIGIAAPRHLAVHRAEVIERIMEENRRALGQQASLRPQPAAAVAPQLVIEIPEGLPGLRGFTRFALVEVEGHEPIRELVSLDEAFVRLYVIDALDLDPSYPVDRARQTARLADEEVAVALVVTLPASGAPPTVNLLAPVVIGMTSHVGKQVILEGTDLPVRCELAAVANATASPAPQATALPASAPAVSPAPPSVSAPPPAE